MSKILIVDDELGIREMLSDILTDEGHTVYTADSAEAARVFMAQDTYDLILLDIWMPNTDGITLLKEWGQRRMLHCPVVMMSGHGTIENAVEATRFGALSFLEKPISMQKLLSTVEHALVVGQRQNAFAKYQQQKEVPQQAPVRPSVPAHLESLPVLQVPGTDITLDFNRPLRELRDDFEKAYLSCVMSHENCQMTRVARHAGLERTHLYRKLKLLKLEIPRGGDTHRHPAANLPSVQEASGDGENL
jgi:DNA-binding response regulator